MNFLYEAPIIPKARKISVEGSGTSFMFILGLGVVRSSGKSNVYSTSDVKPKLNQLVFVKLAVADDDFPAPFPPTALADK